MTWSPSRRELDEVYTSGLADVSTLLEHADAALRQRDQESGATERGLLSHQVNQAVKQLRPVSGSLGLVATADPYRVRSWSIAVLQSGASAVLVDPKTPASELQRLARRFAARWIATSEPTITRCEPTGGAALPDSLGSGLVFLTSGSMGTPKAVFHPRKHLWREAALVAERLGYRAEGTLLCTVPPTHLFGFTLSVLAPLLASAPVVAASPLTVAGFASLIESLDPSWIAAVPQQYRLWSSRRPDVATLSGVVCVSSGAPLPDATRESFWNVWACELAEQYGSSECGVISIGYQEGAGATPFLPGVGRPYRGVELMAGVRGDASPVLVRSGHGATAVLTAESGSWRILDRSKPSETGDHGWTDDEGVLHLSGRWRGFINVHGKKVGIVEVQDILRQLPQVADAYVVPGVSDDGDGIVLAVVEPETAGATSEQELRAACGNDLPAWKVPQRILVVPRLERTSAGKVSHATLTALLTGAGCRVAPNPTKYELRGLDAG